MAPIAPQSKAPVIQQVGEKTKGKATKSLERLRTKMIQRDRNPIERCQHLGEGQTYDCISTRRRWQTSKVK